MLVYPFRTRCGLIINYINFRISLLEEGRKFHFTGITSVSFSSNSCYGYLVCSFSKEKEKKLSSLLSSPLLLSEKKELVGLVNFCTYYVNVAVRN